MPRPDFPRTFPEFVRRFNTDDACFRYIIDSRWPDGFMCVRCGHDQAFGRTDTLALQCRRCNKIYSATAGTVMHRGKQPLCWWLWAAYLMVTDKRGLSAVQLQRQLGIKRYETAYNMLHKLRAATVNPDREKLRGYVEVDETFIGGPEEGKRGRGAGGKALVIGAVEVRNDRPQRVRFRHIPTFSRSHLFKFIKDSVEPGSIVVTDALVAYEGLDGEGYVHRIQSTARGDIQDAVLPSLHIAFSNLKTWLMGTHHGAVSNKHLQAYLSEFSFRYNRRGNLQAAFQTLLGLSGRSVGPTYEGLYQGTFEHRNPRFVSAHKG